MSSEKQRRRSRYGAYELKATYQRNMLAGMVAVFGRVLLVLVSGAIASRLMVPMEEPVTEEVGDTVFVQVDWKDPPKVLRDHSDVSVAGPPTSDVVGVDGYNPVGDDEPITDVALPTVGGFDFPIMGDSGADGDLTGVGGIPSGSDGSGEPRPGKFVKVEIMPEMIYEHKPEYPKLVKKAGIEGTVWIWVAIDEEGLVTKAQVSRTSGNEALDEAALRAAYKCKYSPALQNGRAVKIGVTYKVEFVINDK